MGKTLYMETTKIEAGKTAGEIQDILGAFGCSCVVTEYDDSKNACGISFVINRDRRQLPFRLPINVDPIFKLFQARRQAWGAHSQIKMAKQDLEQARRVAWRQVLRWIQAQIALVDVGMVKTEEVFLPYMTNDRGETLYQVVADHGFSLPQLEDKSARSNAH